MLLASLVGGCGPAAAPPVRATSVDPVEAEASFAAASGLRIAIIGAPSGTTLAVEASDARPPLLATRAVAENERVEVLAGFVTITLRHGSDERRLQLFARAGAELQYVWGDPAQTRARGIEWLDRDAVERAAKVDFEALMTAARASDAAGIEAVLGTQERRIEALSDDPAAHLRRLLHASNAIQILGADAAWAVIEPVPADSIAWAAYSGRLVELRALFGDHPDAGRRFDAVRREVDDLGLAAAFRAGDVLAAERSGAPDAVAKAYVAATTVAGAPRVGRPMPPFELIDVDTRRSIRSQDLLGTPYLVELWSTWCVPCIEAMPALHELHAEVGAGDAPKLRILSVAVNDTRDAVTLFREDRWPMPWMNAWAPDGVPVFEAWSIDSVPFAVLVDAGGTVLFAGPHVRHADVRAAVMRPDAAPGP